MAQHATPAPKSPADHLTCAPEAFEFFQAVRLLEREVAAGSAQSALHAVGTDASPGSEIVRFRALNSHRFPPAPIAGLKRPAETEPNKPTEMVITCLGLTGPSGVLPSHYSQLVIETVRNRDFALRDFLDLFNHRLASLFYRAWGKYRLPIGFEAAQTSTDERRDDPCTVCLYSLVGLGHARLRQRVEFDDLAAVYFGGYLGHYPRNAVSLQALVREFLDMPVDVWQFQGQWLSLDSSDQTRLGSRGASRGQHAALGVTAMAGRRVWGVEGKFAVRVGPLDYSEFLRFMPAGNLLRPVCQLIRLYVGPEFDFEIRPVLRAPCVPASRLGAGAEHPTQLGWNSWLIREPPSVDADSAVFADEGRPSR